ncbi:MAG: hypothetical protein KDA57_08240 [Planctomycetales bacterium]|nr:hypothetical protein [Planctomycetales bacterium]
MNRPNQQLAWLLQEAIRQLRGGRLSARWITGLIAAVVLYLLLQPVLERKCGVDLPGLGDLGEVATPRSPANVPRSRSDPTASHQDLEQILHSSRLQTYESAAGLRYTRGSQHGHRLKHLLAHTEDEPKRPGQHGVFDSRNAVEVVALVDEAYLQALAGEDTEVEHEGDRTVYTVNLGRRIGYIGGESGNRRGRPEARHMRLVLEGRDFVTAFPCQP